MASCLSSVLDVPAVCVTADAASSSVGLYESLLWLPRAAPNILYYSPRFRSSSVISVLYSILGSLIYSKSQCLFFIYLFEAF